MGDARPAAPAVVAVRWADDLRARLREALAPGEVADVHPDDRAGVRAAAGRAVVAVVDPAVDPEVLLASPRLRWVHVDAAGIERWARADAIRRGVVLTPSAGRSAPALAEHAIHLLLALVHRARETLRAQEARRWDPGILRGARPLHGRTLAVAGLGATGREVAVRAAALGMRVVGWRRRDEPAPPGVDRVFSAARGEGVAAALRGADAVVVAASLNDRTRGLVGAAELALLAPGAVLVNVARGALIDEDALVDALRAGTLAGAGLDVFAEEPLPPSSPLWAEPGVLITPHASPALPDRDARSLAAVLDLVARYRRGEPLPGALTEADAWSGPDPRAAHRATLRHRAGKRAVSLVRALRRLVGGR